MILADTSAWIEFDRKSRSAVGRRMADLVIAGRRSGLVVTDPVIAEVASGARTGKRELDLRRLLSSFRRLRFKTPLDFDNAVGIYRQCRSEGVTPRGLMDCMIAAVALRTGAALLARDSGITQVAHVVGIDLDQPAP